MFTTIYGDIEDGLDFDDVLLMPRGVSNVVSRELVTLTTQYRDKMGGLRELVPIFTAPMKNISEPCVFKIFTDNGIRPIYHRFDSQSSREHNIEKLNDMGGAFGIAVGASERELEFAEEAYNYFHNLEWICIDIANGYLNIFEGLKINIPRSAIITGNVVTKEGFEHLARYSGYVRVGIGSGQQCITREVTGIGCPQITAITNCVLSEENDNTAIVSDGGIRSAADVMKALAFGADYVMIGSLFGSALELDNEYIYGMASKKLQEEYYHSVKSVEGRVTRIDNKRPLQDIISDLFWSIKSACTYLNITNLQSNIIYHNTKPIRINRSSLKYG